MLLAIDTATRMISLALYDGRSLLAEQTWRSANQHTRQLAPAVQQMIAASETTFAELTALAVCTGPGSFTGLRIGVALAKGLAAAHQLPLVGVTAMDSLAAAQPHVSGGLITVVEAGRGRIITGRYQWRTDHWQQRGELRLMTWPELIESIDGPAHITGEINAEGFTAIEDAQADGVPLHLVAGPRRLRRAGFLAGAAWQQLRSGRPQQFDPVQVVPVYVKTEGTPS